MSDWKQVSDFVKFTTKGITPSYVENSSIVVLNQKCIRNHQIDYSLAQYTDDTKAIAEIKFVKNGDILINSTGAGTAGRCAFVSELPVNKRLIADSHILILRCSSYFESQCLSYVLFSFEETLMSFMTGSSGQSELDKVALLNLKTKMPTDSAAQQKIAKFLFTLDTKIELNKRINAELETLAKTIYAYWFVQFDFPDENGQPYKSSGGKMVWNDVLKREIPLGWEVCELRKYITSNRGVSYTGKDIVGNGVPMINLNSFNMTDGSYKPAGIKTYSGDYGGHKILKPFDLVMCNTQQTALDPKKDIIGKSFLVPDIFESDIVSSHHVTTITVSKEPLKYYLSSLFNTEYFHRFISGYATGTNILGLNFEGVSSFVTAFPSDDLLVAYKAIIVNIEKQKSRIIKENQTLTELRDWLLPLLMNGQVQVG